MDSKNTKQSLHLPEEVIEEILSRLAVKSLLRFRCFSKSWRSFIDSKRFINTHLQTSITNKASTHHRVFLRAKKNYYDGLKHSSLNSLLNEPNFVPSPFDDPMLESEPIVVGHCNGLACIFHHQWYSLWNPTTRISIELPRIAPEFVPVRTNGFGWDESSGVYKVFTFVYISNKFRAIVYSSEKNSWKRIKHTYGSETNSLNGQFVSGKLHWNRRSTKHNFNDILTFDLKNEVFGLIELPRDCDPLHNIPRRVSLRVLGGWLSMATYDNERTRADVWVLKEESWLKTMAIPLIHEPGTMSSLPSPFCVGANGEILIEYGTTFLVHYPKDNKYKRLNGNINDFYTKLLYVESLVSPDFTKNNTSLSLDLTVNTLILVEPA